MAVAFLFFRRAVVVSWGGLLRLLELIFCVLELELELFDGLLGASELVFSVLGVLGVVLSGFFQVVESDLEFLDLLLSFLSLGLPLGS